MSMTSSEANESSAPETRLEHAAFQKHGSCHLEDDFGFPADSTPSGITMIGPRAG
jgi:hypothetical protein